METVLAAFATTQSEVNAVANPTNQSVVKVIVVNPMIVANADALDRAKSDNRRDVDRLQAAINANSRLKTDLETRRVNVATVLAAELAPTASWSSTPWRSRTTIAGTPVASLRRRKPRLPPQAKSANASPGDGGGRPAKHAV